MRLAIRSLLFVLPTAMLGTACDVHTTSVRGPATSRIALALPKALVAHDPSLASQQSTDDNNNGDQVVKLRIRISVAGRSSPLLDDSFDPTPFCDDGSDANTTSDADKTVCTISVEFTYPGGSERSTFEVVIDAFDPSGVQTFKIGPAKFQLSADGSTASVTAQAVYVGPGSDATGVVMSPRSLVISLGSTASATCSPTRGGVATNVFAPLQVATSNASIATATFAVTGTGARSSTSLVVYGAGPGSAAIFCELQGGSQARDSISVTVNGGTVNGLQIQLVSGGGQSATAGTQLPNSIVIRVVNAAGQPVPGVQVTSTVATQSGALVPAGGTTNTSGTFATQWTLGPLIGTQTVFFGFPGSGPLLSVTATGR